MKNRRKFYRCEACGNIAGIIHEGGGTLACCGKDMAELKANSVDAAKEKHVPVVKRDGGKVLVEVGSAAHPMTAEHHIAWIAVAQDGITQRVSIEPDAPPKAEFAAGNGDVTVYAYCNLHGLWYSEA